MEGHGIRTWYRTCAAQDGEPQSLPRFAQTGPYCTVSMVQYARSSRLRSTGCSREPSFFLRTTNPSQEAHELVKQAGGGGQFTRLCTSLSGPRISGLQRRVGDFLSPGVQDGNLILARAALADRRRGEKEFPAKEAAPTSYLTALVVLTAPSASRQKGWTNGRG